MKFIKNLSLYTFVGFFGAAVNFFLLPLLTHYLSPAENAYIALFNSYVSILLPFVGLMAYSLLNIEFFKTKDKNQFADKFISIHFIPIFPFLFLGIVCWLSFSGLRNFLELQGVSTTWGMAIVFLAFATIYTETFFNLLINQKKVSFYTAATILKVIIEVFITIWLVVYKNMGWQGRIYSWLISTTLYFFVSQFYFYQQGYFSGKIKWVFMREGILFGLPLILHTIGKFVINQSDRLFITKMISKDAAGVYSVGYTIGTLILIVITAFSNLYTPFLMEKLTDLSEEKKLQIVKMNYLFVFGIILLMIIIKIVTPYFFHLFIDKRYWSGIDFVFWVSLSYCFWGGYLLLAGYISFYNRNKILGWLAIVNIILNCVLNYFLILKYGAMGAAYATALSFLVVFIIVAFQANKLVKLPWLKFRQAMIVKL